MGKLLGRLLRILAWISPIYQFRADLYRKSGINIGKNVYMGFMVLMDGEYPEYIEIGDYASIGPGVSIMAHSSGSPFHSQLNLFRKKLKKVTIKRGAWIATRAIILPGVTIGEGAIVAAGAVVSKDVPPYTIAAGNPARVIQKMEKPSSR
jgi:acetyltransferase-like isoleucine patch superfamily enzyme